MTHMASARALDTHTAQKREFGANPAVLQSPQGEAAEARTMHTQSQNPSGQAQKKKMDSAETELHSVAHKVRITLVHIQSSLPPTGQQAIPLRVRGRPVTEAARPAAWSTSQSGSHDGQVPLLRRSRRAHVSHFHRLRQALQDREHLVQDQVTPGTTQEAQHRQHRWKPSLPQRNPSIPGEGCLTVLGCGLAAEWDDDSADDDDDLSPHSSG